jgi:hypothetical protein
MDRIFVTIFDMPVYNSKSYQRETWAVPGVLVPGIAAFSSS